MDMIIKRYKKHGLDRILHGKSKSFTIEEKLAIINRYYAGESQRSLAIELNVNNSVINQWISKYEKFGYNGLIDNRGKPGVSKMGRPRKNQTKDVASTNEAMAPITDAEREELNRLRNTAAEVNVLRSQLAELKPLRKKVAEMDIIRGQVRELNELRKKVVDLGGVKAQLDELNKLKAEISQMNNFQSQLGELKSLKMQVAEAEKLKRKIEEMEKERSQYEQEIQNLRTSQKIELLKIKNMANSRIGSKQLLFEETMNNMLVKGDIIRNMDELEMITRKINKSNNKIILNLLYTATADSDKAAVFHEKCDGAKSSLVLVETNKGKRFGGFTTCSWKGDCIDKQDEEAFIFSLDKMMTYDNISGEDAIGCYPRFGPIFLGCQIRIYDNAFTKGGTTFERGLNYNTEEDYELTDGERVFGVKDIEVYEVITQ